MYWCSYCVCGLIVFGGGSGGGGGGGGMALLFLHSLDAEEEAVLQH